MWMQNIDHERYSDTSTLSVGFILLPEFTLSALAGFIDTMRLSADDNFRSQQKYCSWTIMSADGRGVKASCGVEVLPWEKLRHPIDFDCIVVVGGLVKGHKNIDQRIVDYLPIAHDKDVMLAGLCTGSFALAYAGLMKDRTTCVHWFHKPDFQQEFPDHKCVTDTVYFEDENCITCAGGGVAGDVATYIIERFCGKARARIGVSGMLMESPKGIRSPQPHMEADWFNEIKVSELRRAILVMDQNIRRSFSTAILAKKAGLSKFKFARLFNKELGITASYFYKVMRLAHGHRDVLYTRRNIIDIAMEFGFSDSSHFTKFYGEIFSLSPSAIRNLDVKEALSVIEKHIFQYPGIVRALLSGKLFFSSEPLESGAQGRFNLEDDVQHIE